MFRKTLVLCAALLCALPAAAQTDKAGCADHALFPTRMPGYIIQDCKAEEYGMFDFSMAPREKLPVEGEYTFITYRIVDKSQEPSALAVVRNYESPKSRLVASNSRAAAMIRNGNSPMKRWRCSTGRNRKVRR